MPLAFRAASVLAEGRARRSWRWRASGALEFDGDRLRLSWVRRRRLVPSGIVASGALGFELHQIASLRLRQQGARPALCLTPTAPAALHELLDRYAPGVAFEIRPRDLGSAEILARRVMEQKAMRGE